jgi:DNA helicase-2/ATP-dependent DNA helicase PcrA
VTSLEDSILLEHLNSEQERAVLTTEGPLLILAGAGSGKTRVITRRVAWLIRHLGIHPARILAITFTNKAANEMKERIEELIGLESRGVWVGTFHSMMLRILRRYGSLLGYRPSFTIFDTTDQRRIMADVLKELNISERMLSPREALSIISRYKNDDISPEQLEKRSTGYYIDKQRIAIYKAYQKSLFEKNAMDFDDILTETLRLFREHTHVLEHCQRQFTHILVDEYQDTNVVQYELIRLLAAKSRNLCVVGDDDQSIYGFRGATIRNILDFEDDFPDCTVIRLEQNYRSTKTILAAANQVIRENRSRKKKTLWTAHGEGVPILMYRAADHIDEARFIAREVQRRFQFAENHEEIEIAVLYRMNALSRNLEFALRELGIEYIIYGGTRFYDRAEIKDVTAYLSLIQSPEDEIAFRRVINQPRRGLGSVTLERLAAFAGERGISLFEAARRVGECPDLGRAAGRLTLFVKLIESLRNALLSEELSFAEFVKMVEVDSGLIAYYEELKARGDVEAESRLENLKELISDAIEFEGRLDIESFDDLWEFSSEGEVRQNLITDRSLEGVLRLFLERAVLYSDQDKERETPKVSLMTVHSAKGLEFDTVVIMGAEEGIFPSMQSFQETDGLEEERRLAYVAVTRAKKELIITSAVSRLLFGHTQYNPPSRFSEDISEDLVEKRGVYGSYLNFDRETDSTSYSGHEEFFAEMVGHILKKKQTAAALDDEREYKAVTRRHLGQLTEKKSSGLDPSKLKPGDSVRHVRFGIGEIQNITETGDDAILVIDFDGNIKRFMASQSSLSIDE